MSGTPGGKKIVLNGLWHIFPLCQSHIFLAVTTQIENHTSSLRKQNVVGDEAKTGNNPMAMIAGAQKVSLLLIFHFSYSSVRVSLTPGSFIFLVRAFQTPGQVAST